MSIRNYNFKYINEKIDARGDYFEKTVVLRESPDLLSGTSSGYDLYPSEWIAKWEAAQEVDLKGYGAGGLNKAGNMFSQNDVSRGWEFSEDKHVITPDAKKPKVGPTAGGRGEEPLQHKGFFAQQKDIVPPMPFESDKIPGLDICNSGGTCDPLFWVNYFFTWPLPVRQVRAYSDSYAYNDERTMPGYIKGPFHVTRYGTWDWTRQEKEYYPIGRVVEDWNGGSPEPYLNWVHFVTTTGDEASRYGHDQGGYSKGIANNYLINLSEDEPDIPAIQPKLWHLNVDYDWKTGDADGNVSQKLALYVFLHMVNSQNKILSYEDYGILVDAFQTALRGDDTRSYAQAGKASRVRDDDQLNSDEESGNPNASWPSFRAGEGPRGAA